MKKSTNNNVLYAGVALLGVATLATAFSKKNTDSQELPASNNQNTNNQNTNQTIIDENKVLKKGVSGEEVKILQGFLGVGTDGVFGAITEAALFKLKAVYQTTLKQFKTLPTVNQQRIPSGTNIMSENKSGTKLYKTAQKADGTYYMINDVYMTIGYGQLIGEVRSSTALGNYYLVKPYFYDKDNFDKYFFVKAADVKAIK